MIMKTHLISHCLPLCDPPRQRDPFYFPGFFVYVSYVIQSKNSELGFTNKKEHGASEFQGLGYLTW